MKTLLFSLCVFLLFCGISQAATITFAWDAPDAAPVGVRYKLYVCTDSAMTKCAATDAATALTASVPLAAGTYWVYATAYVNLIETEPLAGIVESPKSNVLNFVLNIPPGNPKNFKIRIQ